MGHSCGTLLWGTLVRNSRTLLWDTLVGHSCGALFVRDFLQKSHVKSPKRAFRTKLPPKVTCQVSCGTLLWGTLRTRLPPKVTRQVSKTSVSYETSSKSHMSSLQNERFVRDFLQKSCAKSPKRAFRSRLPPRLTCQSLQNEISYETSSKSQAETPIGAHTHHAALPSSFASPAPPNNTRSHANPTVTATFTSTTTHDLTVPCACHESFRIHTSNAHKVLRLPRNVTSVTPQPHDSLRLPRKSHFHTSKSAQSTAPATKSDNIISCELQQSLHHTTRLE